MGELIEDIMRPPYQPTTMRENGVNVQDLNATGIHWGPHWLHVRHQTTHTAPSVAFRLDDAFVYCTDTGYDTGNAEFASGCSVLLHEAWFVGEHGQPGHSSAAQAATIARLADVDRLVLVHLPPTGGVDSIFAAARSVFSKTTLAADGQVLEFGQG